MNQLARMPVPGPESRLIAQLADDRQGLLTLQQGGLSISTGLRQVGTQLTFEVPARISTATIIGSSSIGAFSYIGPGSEVRNTEIGRFCSIAANVSLGPAEHPTDWLSSHPFQYDGVRYFDAFPDWKRFASARVRFTGNSASTSVGHDVWIGRGAVIRQGIRVGSGAVVAAGAFVNRDVPPYAIVAGIPARVLRFRFEDAVIARLMRVEWWSWILDPLSSEIDYSRPAEALDQIEPRVLAGELEPFTPTVRQLRKKDGGFQLTEFDVRAKEDEP